MKYLRLTDSTGVMYVTERLVPLPAVLFEARSEIQLEKTRKAHGRNSVFGQER